MTTLYLTLGFLSLFCAVLYAVYRVGKKREQGKEAERNLDAVKEANHVKQKVDALSDAAISNELYKWRR